MTQTWILDFDDVLAMTNLGLIAALDKKFGVKERVANVTNWGYWTKHEHSAYLWSREVFGSPVWTARLQPAAYGAELAHYLIDAGHTVIVLSDRPNHHVAWLEAWLGRHAYPTEVEVIVTNRKHRKVDIAIAYGATHLIDDSPQQLNGYFGSSDAFARIYVMDFPYNQHLTLPASASRVANLLDVLRDIAPERYPHVETATPLV